MPNSSRYLATVRRAVGQPASSSIRHNCWSERGWVLSSSSKKRRSKSWVLPPETVTNRRRGSSPRLHWMYFSRMARLTVD